MYHHSAHKTFIPSSLSSALSARQIARVSRPRPWLSHSTAPSPTSTVVVPHGIASSRPRRPMPTPVPIQPTKCPILRRQAAPVPRPRQVTPSSPSSSSASSSLIARAVARASRDRPWLNPTIKPSAPVVTKTDLTTAPAIASAAIKPHTTAAWVQSQAVDLRQALSSPPSNRLNSWLLSLAISPPGISSTIIRSSVWGRKSSINYPRLLRQAIQVPKPRHDSSTWGRKSSTRLTITQPLAKVNEAQSRPKASSPPLQRADNSDSYIAAIASTVLERYDPKPLREANSRLLKAMDEARLAHDQLVDTLRDLEDQKKQKKKKQDPKPMPPPPRKTVTFIDKPKVIEVPRWIGVDQPKGEHVSSDTTRILGILHAWTPIDNDTYCFNTSWSTWVDDSQFDHSDCQNPECHYRAKDLYMLEPQEEWTPPVWTDDSNVD